jgi:hypothetical protein
MATFLHVGDARKQRSGIIPKPKRNGLRWYVVWGLIFAAGSGYLKKWNMGRRSGELAEDLSFVEARQSRMRLTMLRLNTLELGR